MVGSEGGVSPTPRTADSLGLLLAAGVASIAAGVLHAGAIAQHADTRQAVEVFTGLAAAQVGWGILAIVHRRRWVAAIGGVLGIGALAGWTAVTTVGIDRIEGLDHVHEAGLTDGTAAAMAGLTALFSICGMMGWTLTWGARAAVGTGGAAILVGLVAIPGILSLGSDDHASAAAGGHDHGTAVASDSPSADEGSVDPASDPAAGEDQHDHGDAPAVPPKPYDPLLPIDLGGVPGVSPEQQARAENLIAVTLDRLPRYADPRTAEADGFSSIGDGFTGHEHFVNPAYLEDDHVLNPDYPESLVYEVKGQERTLVSAMFMLSQGQTFDDVPDIGGPLTQWHVHADLCFSASESRISLSGLAGVDQPCSSDTVKLEIPMIHVWITSHRCGPFAALDGVGAGQPPEGETTACDHAHGA